MPAGALPAAGLGVTSLGGGEASSQPPLTVSRPRLPASLPRELQLRERRVERAASAADEQHAHHDQRTHQKAPQRELYGRRAPSFPECSADRSAAREGTADITGPRMRWISGAIGSARPSHTSTPCAPFLPISSS